MLPPNVQYATLRGKFLRAVADGGDDGREPDSLPIPDLKITIRADLSPAVVRNATSTPPVTFFVDQIDCVTDESGVLLDPTGTPDVMVVASDDADLDPHGWTYRATLSAPSIPSVAFSFTAPAGTVVDLSSVITVPPSPGEALVAWSSVVAETIGARDVAVDAAATAVAAAGSIEQGPKGETGADGADGAAGNPFPYGIWPVIHHTGVAWPSRVSSIPPGYTGNVVYDSTNVVGAGAPTDRIAGDRHFKRK